MSGSSKAELLRTLEVRRNAKRGFTVGVVLALSIYVFFVVIPGANHSPLLYVTLGFVLAFSFGALATAFFVGQTARRVAKDAGEQPGDDAETDTSPE
jgi:ABC-type bacteriocin/lantibiotic exporter with double-glycine peptidase domain